MQYYNNYYFFFGYPSACFCFYSYAASNFDLMLKATENYLPFLTVDPNTLFKNVELDPNKADVFTRLELNIF